MLSHIAAIAGAILLQTAPAPQPDISEADAQKALELTQQLLFVLGTCETVLPPEAVASINEKLNNESDPQASALIRASYEAGKASPKAATQTLETCAADMQTVLIEIQTLASRLSDEAN